MSENKNTRTLTLEEVREIIEQHMDEVEAGLPSDWGFSREDILKSLKDLKDKVSE